MLRSSVTPVLSLLFCCASICPAQITPLRDINIGSFPNGGSEPAEFVQVGAWTYFRATYSAAGSELYRTVGAPILTQLVADLNPGASGSYPHHLTAFQNRLCFVANDGVTGNELWSTGATGGSSRLTDIQPGLAGSDPRFLTVFGNRMFFVAQHPSLGLELFVTDGTSTGTSLFMDIAPGAASSWPSWLTVIGNTLWFGASNGSSGIELWQSDGTVAGTKLVKDLNPNNTGTRPHSSPTGFVGVGSAVVFSATGDGVSWGLWRSDGTAGGTYELARFQPANGHVAQPTVSGITAFRSGVAFMGQTAALGKELWFSDGTPSGTRIVRDLNPGAADADPMKMTVVGNTLYFQAGDGRSPGRPVWRTDGTSAGTALMAPSSGVQFITEMVHFQGGLILSVPHQQHGHELWVSDGTDAGTRLLKDIQPGALHSYPKRLTVLSANWVAFAADDGVAGAEPWFTDGTAQNTHLAADANRPIQGSPGSSPRSWFEHRQRGYFAAISEAEGLELWTSDGTHQGTRLVHDVRPGPVGSSPAPVGAIGDAVLFTAQHGDFLYGLWRTTGQGAALVRQFDDPFYPATRRFAQLPGRLVFVAGDQGSRGLWTSDGTSQGTRLLTPLPQYLEVQFAVLDDVAFFTLVDTGYIVHLGRSDGTDVGTSLVKTIGKNPTQRADVHAFGDALLIGAMGELWISDGQAAGTRLLVDIHPNGSSFPQDFITVGDQVFFTADDGQHGYELWRSDGSPLGTRLVRDIRAGAGGYSLAGRLNFDDRFLLFSVAEFGSDAELWRSDGTAAGTTKVLDINPGPEGSHPGSFEMVGSRFTYFYATHASYGRELWRSDGTAAGTKLVQDFGAGATSIAGNYTTPILVGDRLLLTADNGRDGDEPATLDLGALWQARGRPCGALGRPTLRATDPVLNSTLSFSGKGPPPGLRRVPLGECATCGPAATGAVRVPPRSAEHGLGRRVHHAGGGGLESEPAGAEFGSAPGRTGGGPDRIRADPGPAGLGPEQRSPADPGTLSGRGLFAGVRPGPGELPAPDGRALGTWHRRPWVGSARTGWSSTNAHGMDGLALAMTAGDARSASFEQGVLAIRRCVRWLG